MGREGFEGSLRGSDEQVINQVATEDAMSEEVPGPPGPGPTGG